MTPTGVDQPLLLLHAAFKDTALREVAQLATALQDRWDGPVVTARYDRVAIDAGPHGTRCLLDGSPLAPALVVRRLNMNEHGAMLTRLMARMGMAVVNDPAAAAVAGSKAETAVALALAGVPSPRQITHPQGVAPEPALGAGEWQWPLVLKWDKGSSGVGVHLARDAGEAAELLGSVADGLPWVAQQFRAECRGRDLRVYVFGGRVFGGLERWSTTGDFRSNVALGAASAPCPVTREEADVAVRAAAAVGLRVAGVDILRTDDGPMVAEVNSNPVLDTYSRATGSSAIYEAFADAVCAAPAAGAPGASRPVGLTTLSA